MEAAAILAKTAQARETLILAPKANNKANLDNAYASIHEMRTTGAAAIRNASKVNDTESKTFHKTMRATNYTKGRRIVESDRKVIQQPNCEVHKSLR